MDFRITAGLDQGDPFSPVAFAATLLLGELQNAILQAQRVAGIGRPVTGSSSRGDRNRKTAGNGQTCSSRAETEHDQMRDLHAITSGAARHGGLEGHAALRRKAWKQAFKAWERCFQWEKTNSARLRRNCENQDSDGAGTTGTTNCESTSGKASETSGQRVTAPLRRSESGAPPGNAAPAQHWRTRQHG